MNDYSFVKFAAFTVCAVSIIELSRFLDEKKSLSSSMPIGAPKIRNPSSSDDDEIKSASTTPQVAYVKQAHFPRKSSFPEIDSQERLECHGDECWGVLTRRDFNKP